MSPPLGRADYTATVGNESAVDWRWVAGFSASAAGLTFHDARQGPPDDDRENVLASVSIVDTAAPNGPKQIREMIGPTAEEQLSGHPQRFVIYALQREGVWLRFCADEALVRHEVLKIVRQAPEPPTKVEVLLYLEHDLRGRVLKAVADEALRLTDPGGSA